MQQAQTAMQVRHRSVHWIASGSLVVSWQSFCSLIEFFRCSQDGPKGPSCFLAVYFANMLTLRNSPEITSVGPVPTGRHREQWPVGTGPTLDADRQVNSRQFLNAARQRMHYSNVVTTLRSVTFHQPSSLAARRATTSGLSFARLCSSRGSAIRSNNCGRGSVRGCTDL